MITPEDLRETRNQIRTALENQTKAIQEMTKVLTRIAIAQDIKVVTSQFFGELDATQKAGILDVLMSGMTLTESVIHQADKAKK